MFSRKQVSILALIIAFSLVSCERKADFQAVFALTGGTLIDLNDFGKSDEDKENIVVLIADDKIAAVGTRNEVTIPEHANVIDVRGKFIVPGLIDGFSTLNNQAYANAHLYMGVTTIVGLEGERRGKLFTEADPSPEILGFGTVDGRIWSDSENAYTRWQTDEEIIKAVDLLAKRGTKVVLLYYSMNPNQLELAVQRCKELGMATIGELGYATYAEAVDAGVQSFVHTSRYSVDIVAAKLREEYKDSPFGEPRNTMYRYYSRFTPETNGGLLSHAEMLGSSDAALIPTMSIFYPSFAFAINYWEEPVADLIDRKDIHLPVDRITGKWTKLENTAAWDTLVWSEALVDKLLRIEQTYYGKGATYLAGTGVDAFGAMPGIAMHVELEMLTRIGLTNREALAAATSNYSEIFGWNHIGRIEVGREADLLILNDNPILDIENLKKIDFLFLDGELIERRRLLN